MLDARPIKSPCVSVCVMDPATGWCEGCFRTLAEIGAWARLSAAERERVMLLLPMRRKAACSTPRPPEEQAASGAPS